MLVHGLPAFIHEHGVGLLPLVTVGSGLRNGWGFEGLSVRRWGETIWCADVPEEGSIHPLLLIYLPQLLGAAPSVDDKQCDDDDHRNQDWATTSVVAREGEKLTVSCYARTEYLEHQGSGNGECGGRARPSGRGGMCRCLRCACSSPPNDEPIPFCDPRFHRVQHVVEWLALARRPRWLPGNSDHCDWTAVALWWWRLSRKRLVSGEWSQEAEGEKSKVSTSGSKPIFLQAANAGACMGMQGCRLPTELVYIAHEPTSYFPMSSPCSMLDSSVRTPHPMPKFIDRQGQGQGGPWTVQMNTGGCSPAQLPHWDDGECGSEYGC